MLELQKKYCLTNQPLKVIIDQVGSPKNTYSLANLFWEIIRPNKLERSKTLIFHWIHSGLAIWYYFAEVIGKLLLRNGLISRVTYVIPILSKNFKLKASRPKYSFLNSYQTKIFFNIKSSHWRDELKKILKKPVLTSSNKIK
tara:strand:+ start:374 stop:799 length:426 start_codon:yes stop_codon:yes gene_type:complete